MYYLCIYRSVNAVLPLVWAGKCMKDLYLEWWNHKIEEAAIDEVGDGSQGVTKSHPTKFKLFVNYLPSTNGHRKLEKAAMDTERSMSEDDKSNTSEDEQQQRRNIDQQLREPFDIAQKAPSMEMLIHPEQDAVLQRPYMRPYCIWLLRALKTRLKTLQKLDIMQDLYEAR